MAIVVESERSSNTGSIVKFVLWLVILGVIVAAIYYVFFKTPEFIPNIIAPSNFKDTTALSQITIDPNSVVQSAAFKSLRQYAEPLAAPAAGRANPFQ